MRHLKSKLAKSTLAGALFFAPAQMISFAALAQSSPVVLTFSTVGDSRQDPVTYDKASVGETLSGQDAKWLQSTKAFSRILVSIQAQKSKILFFNGDMIHGYGIAGIGYTSNLDQSQINGTKGNNVAPIGPASTADIIKSDLLKFYQQYAFWRGMIAPMMEAGTYVMPVPGNHETQCKPCGKVARPENEEAWSDNMGDLIVDTARFMSLMGEAPQNVTLGPIAGASPDGLTTDQSKLSYSFDSKGAHFSVINTDAVGKDAMAPTKWLAADFQAAKARGIKRFFVFGHKPAFTYNYLASGEVELGGLDAVPANLAARDAFWDVIEAYEATYFSGHEHVYNISQPRGKAYQVIVGSGGSPFDAKAGTALRAPATDRTYAWATVNLHQDASAEIITYGFDEKFGETRQLNEIKLR
jgi:hypothetical protein